MLVLALKQVVEDDLQRPWLKQAGDAFAGNREKPEPELAAVGPKQFKDVQTTLGANCLRIHGELDADLSS